MRIAIVTETYPPEVNGVAMTMGRIVEGLLRRGHAVQVVRPRQSREAVAAPPEGLDEVLAKGVPLPAYGELRLGLPSTNRLTSLWRERRPDIVHVVTEGPLGWSAVVAARKLQLPVTSSFHTNFQIYSQHYGISLLKMPIEAYLRKLHNRTQATMVPTNAMVRELRARGYQNVTLLSRGVATEQFHPEHRSQALRAEWGVGPDDLVVLLVGRLAKEKNVGLVVSAFRAIQTQLPSARLVLVGDGPLRKALEESCPEVHFAGIRKGQDLAAHYASADLFLFPSMTETFGNVVPEAMASGLALVSYDNAAAGELIVSGENGLLVPNGDDLAFVSAAVGLATNPAQIAQFRRTATASVANRSWDTVYDRFAEILRTVLQAQGCMFSPAPQERLPHPHARPLL
ncbi:MAG: glycosyltransferase family 1 protein [Burkholderiales bacterium]|nr:glycosyltransferase family 1 protein [Burkholderiales bacterium]